MSDRTYLNFPILQGKNKVEMEDMPAFLQHGLQQMLTNFQVPDNQIARTLTDFEEIAVTRATSRSSLAMHAAIANDYAQILQSIGGIGTHNLTEVILRVNELPRRNLNWANSKEATLLLLAASEA